MRRKKAPQAFRPGGAFYISSDWLLLSLQNFSGKHESCWFRSAGDARKIYRQASLRTDVRHDGSCSAIIGAHALDFDSQCAFQLKELGTLFLDEQRGSYAVSAVAASSADAVDEIFGHFRQVIINDVGDVFNVNTARREVGGYQNAIASLLKSSEGGGTLRLRAVAVNHGRREALAVKVVGDALGSALGA